MLWKSLGHRGGEMKIPHLLLPMPTMIPAPSQPGAEPGHPCYATSEFLTHRMYNIIRQLF